MTSYRVPGSFFIVESSYLSYYFCYLLLVIFYFSFILIIIFLLGFYLFFCFSVIICVATQRSSADKLFNNFSCLDHPPSIYLLFCSSFSSLFFYCFSFVVIATTHTLSAHNNNHHPINIKWNNSRNDVE